MAVQEMLIAELRSRFAGESDSAIARRAGIKQARFSNYVQGVRSMDDDAIIGCAEALGLDATPLVKQHRAEKARTKREASFWRHVAAVAAISLCAMGSAYPADFSSNGYGPMPLMSYRWYV